MATFSEGDFNDFDMGISYHWGFDCFRTPLRYGLGVELAFKGRFLVALRIGSLWLSWGQQIAFDGRFTTTTT